MKRETIKHPGFNAGIEHLAIAIWLEASYSHYHQGRPGSGITPLRIPRQQWLALLNQGNPEAYGFTDQEQAP